MPGYDPAEWYHGHGGVMRRIDPDVPTAICGECGERFKTRRDGTVAMHTRAARDGEPASRWRWCEGGLPAGAR